MNLICIDIGTTCCKISCISCKGIILAANAFDHNAQLPNNEIEAEQIFQSIARELKKFIIEFNDIEAITVTSFGETVVCTGSNNKALCPSILYFDTRTKPQVEELCLKLGEDNIYNETGHRFGTVSTLTKLLWIRQHAPDIFEKTYYFLFVADYILYRLGARPFTSSSFAVRSAFLSSDCRSLWKAGLDAAGIPLSKIAPITKPGEIVGTLSDEFCSFYKTKKPPKLISGGHDQSFATLGAGAFNPKDAAYGMGTSGSLNIVLKTYTANKNMHKYGFDCECFLNEPSYLTFAHTPSDGKSLTWAYSILFPETKHFEWANCEKHIKEVAEGRTDVIFLPLINGAGTPYSEKPVSGSFFGLTDQTDKNSMLLAVLEGVAFEMKLNIELLHDIGIEIDRITVSGGGTRSEDWLQLRANILEKALRTCSFSNTGMLGLFAVASVTLGYFDSIRDAILSTNPENKIVVPNTSRSKYYLEKYKLYKKIREFSSNNNITNRR